MQDRYLSIMWQASNNMNYAVGLLARIDGNYYLKVSNSKNNSAFRNGFRGIPSFDSERLYRSDKKLFEFFNARIPQYSLANIDPIELLMDSEGKVPTDSYFVEEVPAERRIRTRELLLALEKKQREEDLVLAAGEDTSHGKYERSVI